jgi:hypothetical protein
MESLPAPAVPGSAAPDGLQVRVEAAAFALLREGKNPTVARVRERIGGGSPNAVTPALQRWRLTFAAQLQANAGAALDTLPPGVLEIVQALWSRALFEAHRVRSEARSTSDALEQLSTAIAELNERLAAVRERALPLDFLSPHTYGNLPLNFKPLLERYGYNETEVWWTEWGVTPTHFHPINDLAFGAPFILHGMRQAQTSAEWLAYWVLSDWFEELGRPPRLFHGGFGLLTVGGLRKPRYWALRLAEQGGTHSIEAELTGDGVGTLVDGWATQTENGDIMALVWNGTLDQGKQLGHPLLDRRLRLNFSGITNPPRRVRMARVDNHYSNILDAYQRLASFETPPDWPTTELWDALRQADQLDEREVSAHWERGVLTVEAELPMPGVLRVWLEGVEPPQ